MYLKLATFISVMMFATPRSARTQQSPPPPEQRGGSSMPQTNLKEFIEAQTFALLRQLDARPRCSMPTYQADTSRVERMRTIRPDSTRHDAIRALL